MGERPTEPFPETQDQSATQVVTADAGGGAPPSAKGMAPSSGDSGRRRTLMLVAIVVIILLVGACGAAFLWQRRQALDAEQRAAEAERLLEEARSDEATAVDEPDVDEAPEDDGSFVEADEPEADQDEDGRFIGYITDIYNVMQARWIQIDYIQFLTGDEAAAAAASRGDESPPPNDYYIVNENPRLRDFNVREGLEVAMWTWNMPVDGVTEQHIPFDIWWDAIEMGGQDEYVANPYWVTVDNGTVIEIEEQYLP